MDLWQLYIFRKVIAHKGFSRAAKVIHLSQPTISSHIKDLENHFGCKLIDRLGKEVVPTKAGALLNNYAGRLLSLQEETEVAMAEFQGKMSGQLIIGGSTIPGGYILPRIIGKFIKEYPEVNIALIVGDTKKIINDILSSEVELGIVGAKADDKKISQEKIIEDDMRVMVPGTHKWANRASIGLSTLLEEPFIIREKGSGTLSSIYKSLSEKGKDRKNLNIVSEMGSTEAVIQGIKSMVGISILSPIAVADELKAGTLKALTIKDLNLKRSFYLTWHKDRSASPLGKAFMDFIKKSQLGADGILNEE